MCDFTLCCGHEGRPLSEERNILVYGNKILRGKFESKGMNQWFKILSKEELYNL